MFGSLLLNLILLKYHVEACSFRGSNFYALEQCWMEKDFYKILDMILCLVSENAIHDLKISIAWFEIDVCAWLWRRRRTRSINVLKWREQVWSYYFSTWPGAHTLDDNITEMELISSKIILFNVLSLYVNGLHLLCFKMYFIAITLILNVVYYSYHDV